MVIYFSVFAPCAQIDYITQLITAPPVQLLPGIWGTAQLHPSKALQPVSHAQSPARGKETCGSWCGQGAAVLSSSCRRARKLSSGSQLHSLVSVGRGSFALPRAPQLLNCHLLAPIQGVGCSHTSLQNSSPSCNPGGGVIAAPRGETSQLPFWDT